MESPYGSPLGRATWCAAVLLLCSCRMVPAMSQGERNLVASEYDSGYFTLRQSVYFGPFYDDPGLLLLDARPFDELPYLLGPTGKPVSPGASRGIIPAGTRVRVERVEMPTLGTMLGRPLLTPRFNGQVRLRINRFDVADLPRFEDRTHVLLLPIGLTSAEQADTILSSMLGKDDDVKDWLDRRSATARRAIMEKRAVPGLTFEELVAALGLPDRIDREEPTAANAGKREIAHFGRASVTLLNDVVTTVE